MLTDGPSQVESEILKSHFSYLEALTEQGVVVMAGRTLTADDSSFGIVIFKAESEGAAAELMQADPGVKEGVMRAELFPFRIALMSGA